jgi:dUTP pyrophosphatase
MKVKIKKLSELAFIPERGSNDAAGWDLLTPIETLVHKGRQVIPLGIAIEIPKGHYAGIEPRSGNECKGIPGISRDTWDWETFESNRRFDCDVLRGIVDADYRGQIGVIVNNNDDEFYIPRGSKIAQMVLHEFKEMDFEEVEELSDTERSTGGFGSTDSHEK